MTFAVGHVEGGTHAGWRKVKQKPGPWPCKCEPGLTDLVMLTRDEHGIDVPIAKAHPGYLTRCPDCKAERP